MEAPSFNDMKFHSEEPGTHADSPRKMRINFLTKKPEESKSRERGFSEERFLEGERGTGM